MSDPRRLVPRPPQAPGGMLDLSESEGWRFLDDEEQQSSDATAVFVLADGTTVEWHEDEMTGLGYATVVGPSATSVSALITQRLDVLEADDFAEFVQRQPTPRDVGHALYAVAVATEGRPRDEQVERILLDRLADPDPTVRRYAALAASLVPWPALHDRIVAMSKDDPDEEVRETATLVVDDLAEAADTVRER